MTQAEKPKRKAPSKAWKPGQSGNPAGRPKKKDKEVTEALIKISQEKIVVKDPHKHGAKKNTTYGEEINRKLMDALARGKIVFPSEVDGQPDHTIDMKGGDYIKMLQIYYNRTEGTAAKALPILSGEIADEGETFDIAKLRNDRILSLADQLDEMEERGEDAEAEG